jgi:hypothetical protein
MAGDMDMNFDREFKPPPDEGAKARSTVTTSTVAPAGRRT